MKLSYYCAKPVFTFSQDGIVTFSDHLSPEKGSEEAWSLLMEMASQHNALVTARIEALTAERDALRSALDSLDRLTASDAAKVAAVLARYPNTPATSSAQSDSP